MNRTEDYLHTPLHETHRALGARMTPFGGYLMPLQYKGILSEHLAARNDAALFDTCHMGEFRLSGNTALRDLERLVTCPVSTLRTGLCRYGFMCDELGGTVDDMVLYRLADDDFMMVVNAGNRQGDREWILGHLSSDTRFTDVSDQTAKIDLQGPGAPAVMARLMDDPIEGMAYYRWGRNRYKGRPVLTSRTGYTGEIGFELYLPPELAPGFWLDATDRGAVPAGLGARDTLRLEMGMPLYGHELSRDRSPATTGLVRAISGRKNFIGASAALNADRLHERLAGIVLSGRRAARAGDRVLSPVGRDLGIVTSGSYSLSLGRAIGLAFVDCGHASPGEPVVVAGERNELTGTIAPLPLYTLATGRRPLAEFLDKQP